MDFSDLLRMKIEKIYGLDLGRYKWEDSFFEEFMNINLNNIYEINLKTIREVYTLGLNIGNCNLTSRYFANAFNDTEIVYGNCKLLKGTTNCATGSHVWLVYDKHYIDTTLKIEIPILKAKELGYTKEKQLDHKNARILSEYQLYDNMLTKRNQNIQAFNNNILSINPKTFK